MTQFIWQLAGGRQRLNLQSFKGLNTAKNYYKTGVAIEMKSIIGKNDEVFPRGLINNRPFIRCLHDLGLFYYGKRKSDEALMIFSKSNLVEPK